MPAAVGPAVEPCREGLLIGPTNVSVGLLRSRGRAMLLLRIKKAKGGQQLCAPLAYRRSSVIRWDLWQFQNELANITFLPHNLQLCIKSPPMKGWNLDIENGI